MLVVPTRRECLIADALAAAGKRECSVLLCIADDGRSWISEVHRNAGAEWVRSNTRGPIG
jgi:hypothetical protein